MVRRLPVGDIYAASQKARAARAARSELTAALRSGQMEFAEALARARKGELTRRMRVKTLIRAVRGVGALRCATILQRVGISETRRVSGLTQRQYDELVDIIANRGWY